MKIKIIIFGYKIWLFIDVIELKKINLGW